MEKFTGVRFDSELGEYEAVVCGEVEGHGNTAREASAKLQTALAWRATVAAKTQAANIAQNATQAPITATPVQCAAPVVKVAQTVAARPRCVFHKAIRRCFAIACDAGLDTRADDAMREAFAAFLGRAVPSRDSMNGRDWLLVGDAIKSRRLAW